MAKKYDSSKKRRVGRPRTKDAIVNLVVKMAMENEPWGYTKRSPNLNAYAERFVRSIKEECLDQMILFCEKSLRHAVSEYVEHYHRERNHQGLEGRIIQPQFRVCGAGEIKRRERLGGVLNFYCREAA